jgi:hypothetical protein
MKWKESVSKSVIGWIISLAGMVLWFYGYLATGNPPIFDWQANTAWWISDFFPNVESEIGMALVFVGMVPIYWTRIISLGLRGLWRRRDDNYDVLEDGVVVGRIFLSPAAPEHRPWMWTRMNTRGRPPAFGYEPTRAAAMAAFSKSWQRE